MWEQADQWHGRATEDLNRLAPSAQLFCTTSFVLLECGNAAARRPYRAEVLSLRERLEGKGRLINPTDADCELAWTAYRRGEFGEAGIVDQVSIVVMRRLGITRAFTNDRHFAAAGLTTMF